MTTATRSVKRTYRHPETGAVRTLTYRETPGGEHRVTLAGCEAETWRYDDVRPARLRWAALERAVRADGYRRA